MKTKANGMARVLQSALAMRQQRGLSGQATVFEQAYAYLKKHSHWMRYHAYRRQHLPSGGGITEAACKLVFTQRLKRSEMSWTIAGGQVILDLCVLWLNSVWDNVHQRHLASKPMPVTQGETAKTARRGQQAA